MKPDANEKGRVVVSLAGHDAGVWYAVLGTEPDGRLRLCDGENHKLLKPKIKRSKHVRPLPLTVPVDGKGGSGGPVTDGDIRKALKEARLAYEAATAFQPKADPVQDKEEEALVQE